MHVAVWVIRQGRILKNDLVNETWKNPNTFILTHGCDVVVWLGEVQAAHFWIFRVWFAAFQDEVPFISHSHVAREAVKLHVFRLAGERGALWYRTIITHFQRLKTFVVEMSWLDAAPITAQTHLFHIQTLVPNDGVRRTHNYLLQSLSRC